MQNIGIKRRLAILALAMAAAFALALPATAWAADDALTAGTAELGEQEGAAAADAGKATLKVKAEKPAKQAFKKRTTKLDVNTAKGWLIPDGTYFFALANDATRVMGANGVIADKTGKANQAWKIEFDYNSQCYTITNAKTGKALTAAKKAKKGAKVYEATLEKQRQRLTQLTAVSSFVVPIPTQRWMLRSSAKGYYFVSAADKTMVVDLGGERAVMKKSGSKGCKPHFWPVGRSGTYAKNGLGEGTYTIKSQASGTLLNVKGSSVKANAKVSVGKALTLWGQVFELEHASGGWYRIVSYNSGMSLTAAGGTAVQRERSGKAAAKQLWKPKVVGADGAVQLINKATGKALSVKSKKAAPKLAKPNAESKAQRWVISPTTTGLTTIGQEMLFRANKNTSKTRHIIVIDMTAHEYILMHKAKSSQSGAPWVLEDSCRCSTGAHHCTWEGVSSTGSYPGRVPGVPAKYCLWATHGSWIHSIVTYGPQGDNQMGWYISAGCIRLPYKNAEYVFKHTKTGTRIVRYY